MMACSSAVKCDRSGISAIFPCYHTPPAKWMFRRNNFDLLPDVLLRKFCLNAFCGHPVHPKPHRWPPLFLYRNLIFRPRFWNTVQVNWSFIWTQARFYYIWTLLVFPFQYSNSINKILMTFICAQLQSLNFFFWANIRKICDIYL